MTGNHRWASKLFKNVYYDIKTKKWLDEQKKRQLTMVISNSWWIYINSLSQKQDGEVQYNDLIKYIDAYNRFFSFLSELDDFYQFTNFFESLLKNFMQMKELDLGGVTKFINSFCLKVKEREQYLKLLELQLLLSYLRNSVKPSDLFDLSLEKLEEITFKLDPNKRALFLYVFLENVNVKYQVMDNSKEFVEILNKIIGGRISSYLKEEFMKLSRININQSTFSTILEDLEGLISYLCDIGEYSWIIVIVRNIYSKILDYESLGDPISYVRRYIDFVLARNRFEVVYEIYDLIEDIFMYQTDLGYDTVLIDLWLEAANKFVDKKEEKFLQNSLNKLNIHLKVPRTNSQIFHFFNTCNSLWKLKSRFYSLDQQDFWNMMFYRALFEEKDLELAKIILPYLDDDIQSVISDLDSLYRQVDMLKAQTVEKELNVGDFIGNGNFDKMILRIDLDGLMSYQFKNKRGEIVHNEITSEFWNDAQIMEIFNDLFSGEKEKLFKFNLIEFGKLLFIFLPKELRELLKYLDGSSRSNIPQIYVSLQKMTVPMELVYLNNFLMLNHAISYHIGSIPLEGISFAPFPKTGQEQSKYNVLIIEVTNSKSPLKWNDDLKQNELIFPFQAREDEIDHIINFFNRPEIHAIEILNEFKSSRENILTHIEQGAYNIIHIVGNIYYSKWSPKDSYILTNDNKIITFDEINNALKRNTYKFKPFLFFNTQIYNVEGDRLRNTVSIFSEIVANFNVNDISGIISRNFPIFNQDTRQICQKFYLNLFEANDQSTSLLKARKEHKNFLAMSSYIIFGKPWKKL